MPLEPMSVQIRTIPSPAGKGPRIMMKIVTTCNQGKEYRLTDAGKDYIFELARKLLNPPSEESGKTPTTTPDGGVSP